MSLGHNCIVLVTGSTGYIGTALCQRLFAEADSLGIKEIRAFDVVVPQDDDQYTTVAPTTGRKYSLRNSVAATNIVHIQGKMWAGMEGG